MSGESQGSPEERFAEEDREVDSDVGERSRGTVVGADASLAFVGTGNRGPEVRISLPRGSGRVFALSVGRLLDVWSTSGDKPSLLVRTVLRLLSSAEAAAVFLFASARSRNSIVS